MARLQSSSRALLWPISDLAPAPFCSACTFAAVVASAPSLYHPCCRLYPLLIFALALPPLHPNRSHRHPPFRPSATPFTSSPSPYVQTSSLCKPNPMFPHASSTPQPPPHRPRQKRSSPNVELEETNMPRLRSSSSGSAPQANAKPDASGAVPARPHRTHRAIGANGVVSGICTRRHYVPRRHSAPPRVHVSKAGSTGERTSTRQPWRG